jgi:4-aminobutyrate aminotransferase-like enzyme
MFLAIAGDQIEQDLQPLLGRKTSIGGAVRSLGLSLAIELADDRLH